MHKFNFTKMKILFVMKTEYHFI